MGLQTRRAAGSNAVNYINFVFRVCQFIIGVTVLILYATQPSYQAWNSWRFQFSLGIAAGAIAVITTPFLGVTPFLLGYKPVGLAFVWDFIVMAVYAATFAYFKKQFPYGSEGSLAREAYHNFGISYGRIDAMRAAVTIDVVGMALWLVSFFMAISVLLWTLLRTPKPAPK